MPLADRTNTLAPAASRGKSVIVPSRYASATGNTGMPSLRSQLESATRRLAERATAERADRRNYYCPGNTAKPRLVEFCYYWQGAQ